MSQDAPHDQARALMALVAERGESLAGLSRLIGRNAAYLQQFVARGSPRRLAEGDRRLITSYLGVDEARLGGPAEASALVRVPRIDARASAGPGALVEREQALGSVAIDPAEIRRLGAVPGALSVITARGDSMLPTIADGDELLVDGADRRVGTGGVFVARVDGALVVKRLARRARALVALSDNPAYAPIEDLPIEPVGRVIRLTRRLR